MMKTLTFSLIKKSNHYDLFTSSKFFDFIITVDGFLDAVFLKCHLLEHTGLFSRLIEMFFSTRLLQNLRWNNIAMSFEFQGI